MFFLVGVFVGAMRATFFLFFFHCFVIYTFIFPFSVIIPFSFFLARENCKSRWRAGELGVSGCCFSVFYFVFFDHVFLVMGVHKFKCWLSYIFSAVLKQ